MNIQQAIRAIKANMKTNRPTFLWGAPGNAKTQMPKQLAEEMGYGYIGLYLGQSADVADILGLMRHNDDGTFTHSRPAWFPTSGKWIIHLDEFNRCHPDLIQSMYSFLQTGKFGPHQLPPDCYFIGSGNPDNENHQVTNIDDDALRSRFNHLNVELSLQEWLAYAEKKGVHENIVNFLRENPEYLGSTPIKALNDKDKPNPRTWMEAVSKLESDDTIEDIRFEVYSGIIGTTVASRFIQFRNNKEQKLSYKQILESYPSIRKTVLEYSKDESVRLDQLNVAIEEIVTRMENNDGIEKKHVENFKKFMIDIPLELCFKASERISKSKFALKDMIVNDPEFLKKFKRLRDLK